MSSDKINSNPIIHRTTEESKNVYESLNPWSIEFLSNNDGSDDDYEFNQLKQSQVDVDNSIEEPIDSQEVFELLKDINDPEHPLTLEQLAVVSKSQIEIDDENSEALIMFTPTIPHCSMSTLIGLCLRVRLIRSLPPRFKVDVKVREGTHQQEHAINKQLNDKERVAAALENNHLIDVVQQCLSTASSH